MEPKLVKLENGDYVNINYIKALSGGTGAAYLVGDDPAKGQAVHLTDKDRKKVIETMGSVIEVED
ncbi:hypothetical protein MOO45_02795 [Bombilactobacillus folatiphilus]|uniref:Uncharacterized protein n=1 Tax=Bombilactobacillus folatiphilus TaxID=2923362 RepID=A0ABY4PA27_9LACO|nr:hypothetical protein [Bombilactobacillus folatiphilus]UQS82593.1 hypothetical protein MOO45_02795 [Bombilactobacillus folatiphilus]